MRWMAAPPAGPATRLKVSEKRSHTRPGRKPPSQDRRHDSQSDHQARGFRDREAIPSDRHDRVGRCVPPQQRRGGAQAPQVPRTDRLGAPEHQDGRRIRSTGRADVQRLLLRSPSPDGVAHVAALLAALVAKLRRLGRRIKLHLAPVPTSCPIVAWQAPLPPGAAKNFESNIIHEAGGRRAGASAPPGPARLPGFSGLFRFCSCRLTRAWSTSPAWMTPRVPASRRPTGWRTAGRWKSGPWASASCMANIATPPVP
jgi:hypothetical protein